MAGQRHVGVELGGGTRPQFGWEEMPGWGTSVGQEVVEVHSSSASNSRVLVVLVVLVMVLVMGLVVGLIFL